GGAAADPAEWRRRSLPEPRRSRPATGRGETRALPPPTGPYAGLARLDEEVRAAILRPTRLGLLGANRPLLPVADDGDAVGLDTLGHEIVHRRFRAPLAERQVVLVGAALVAVAFDQHEVVAVRLQPPRVCVE